MRLIKYIYSAGFSIALLGGSAAAQPLLPPISQPDSSASNEIGEAASIETHEVETMGISSSGVKNAEGTEPLPIGKGCLLSLDELEQMALSSNPAFAQAAARVVALQGRYVQVGLPPNPTAGYLASEIGQEGTSGQQGGYVGQEFVTGGKLRLDQVVVCQEVQQAQQLLEVSRLRVLTDIRQAYYAALIAKRRLDVANELLEIGAKSVSDSNRLKTLGEIAKTDVLPVEIEQRNAQIVAATARAEQDAAWRRLSAVVGSELPQCDLAGDLTKLPELLTYDDQLARLTSTSPEIAVAMAEISRSQAAIVRARREPVPNVQTQFTVQQDNTTGSTITGVMVGVPLPIWNRNQGGIMQSEAQLAEAHRNANRVELNLKNRLALAFQRYEAAQERVKIYTDDIVPKAEENFELVRKAYPAQVGSIEFLIAQRIYSQTKLSYLDALSDLWSSWTDISGLLLSNSLNSSPETLR